MNKNVKSFLCKLFCFLFLIVIISCLLNNYFSKSKTNIENMENIGYLDIIYRLFSYPDKKKESLSNIREGKIQDYTGLGGNAGPNILPSNIAPVPPVSTLNWKNLPDAKECYAVAGGKSQVSNVVSSLDDCKKLFKKTYPNAKNQGWMSYFNLQESDKGKDYHNCFVSNNSECKLTSSLHTSPRGNNYTNRGFILPKTKIKEGLDNIGLKDFTNLDPNIRPTPIPDICIGNGNFISQPNSTIPVTATAGYLHSNIGACENECTPERGCFAIAFDRASKDAIKKCNIYSGAASAGRNTVKSGTLCSRISPTCSVADYKLNNTSSNIATVIKPNRGEYYTHSSEAACAVECNNRDNCIGYLYDNKSKKYMKPCRIFSKTQAASSKGFPVAGICSKNIPVKIS